MAIARKLLDACAVAGYRLNFSTQAGWASNSPGNSGSSTVTVLAPDLKRSGAVEAEQGDGLLAWRRCIPSV